SDKFEIHHNAFSFHQANGGDGRSKRWSRISECQSSSLVQLRYEAHVTTTIKFRFRSCFVGCDDLSLDSTAPFRAWHALFQAGVSGGQRNEIVFNGNRNRATHIELVTTRDSHSAGVTDCLMFLEFLTE